MIKIATLVGTILAAIIAGLTLWGSYGWVTRQAYAVDEQVEVAIHKDQASQASIDGLIILVQQGRTEAKSYHDEWRCDEADEAVIELSVSIDEATNNRTRIVLTNDLKKIEEVRSDLNCSQFTDE